MSGETLYYDAVLFGGTTTKTYEAKYKDTRTQNILEKQQNWRASIVSMSIPTTFIPIRVVEIEKNLLLNPTPQNINMTVYRISLIYDGKTYEEPLLWIPQATTNWDGTNGVPTDVEQNTIIDVDHYPYYSLRNINHFVYILNNALNEAFIRIKNVNIITSTAPPFFIFNGSLSLFNIYVPKSFITDDIQIIFNYKLNRFFEVSFPCFYGDGGARFLLNEMMNPINTTTHDGVEYLVQQQTHNTVSKFYTEGGFRTLEVVSETLQVNNEFIQNQNGNNGVIQLTGSAYDSILTDYRVGIEQGDELKTTLIYNPTAQYRYLTMTGTGPLKNIEFFIRYKDNFGNAYPLLLPFGECAMIKILFERIKDD